MNKAVLHSKCHFWSCGDSETFFRYFPSLHRTPTVWTHGESYQRIISHHGWVESMLYERSEQGDNRWSMYSATAALWLAKELGAERVECFGVDMAGALNWDGTPEATANRSESRWDAERVVWTRTVELLNLVGIEVVRHGHH